MKSNDRFVICIAWCLTFSAAAANAQGASPFANDYDRNVYCGAAVAFVSQSPDIKALGYWLNATTAEGTRLGFTTAQNSQAVNNKVVTLQNMVANNQVSQIQDIYRRYCGIN
jgi:hypothetical protein